MQGDCDSTTQDSMPPPKPDLILAGDLMGATGQVRIEHEGEIYVLRVTRNNKLILTK